MIGKYANPQNLDQLFHNLLFDVRGKLTVQEFYNITRQYDIIMLQEKLQQQEQEKKNKEQEKEKQKQEQKQEQAFLEQVKKKTEKTIAEVIKTIKP